VLLFTSPSRERRHSHSVLLFRHASEKNRRPADLLRSILSA
jgi:hypothetical protein